MSSALAGFGGAPAPSNSTRHCPSGSFTQVDVKWRIE